MSDRRDSWYARMDEKCIQSFVHESKVHLKGPRRKWEDNMKTGLKNRLVDCVLDSRGSGYAQMEDVCGTCNKPPEFFVGGVFVEMLYH